MDKNICNLKLKYQTIYLTIKYTIFLIFISFQGNISSAKTPLNETYIFSANFKSDYQDYFFKTYLQDDQVNYTNLIYTEMSFNFYQDKQEKIFNSYYKVNVYWFTELIETDFTTGVFYGVGQTKINQNGTGTFSDLAICRIFQTLSKCEDYHIVYNNTDNIIENMKMNFTPIKDDSDNILNYEMQDVITSQISPYNSLLNFKISLPAYAEDINGDLDLDFKNNVTIFFGSLGNEVDNQYKRFYEIQNFNIMRGITRNITLVLLSENFVKQINLFCVLLIFTIIY
jgi:hypothetical protein